MREDYRNAVDRIALTDGKKSSAISSDKAYSDPS